MFSQGAAKPPLAARQPQAHSDLGAVRLRQGLEDVSHRSGIGGDPLERRRLRQHRRLLDGELARSRARAGQIGSTLSSQTHRPMAADVVSTGAPSPRTLLTVQTVFSRVRRILMILLPAWPSRLNVMSMPSPRRNVCTRRRRPASARGFLGQPALLRETSSPAQSAQAIRRSEALPVQLRRSAMISRTQAATGSVSMTLSIAALRFA